MTVQELNTICNKAEGELQALAAALGAAGTGRDPSVSESGPALPPPRARAGDPIGTRGPTNRAGEAACCSGSGPATGNQVCGGLG